MNTILPNDMYKREHFLSEVNSREIIAAIEANNDTYCLPLIRSYLVHIHTGRKNCFVWKLYFFGKDLFSCLNITFCNSDHKN